MHSNSDAQQCVTSSGRLNLSWIIHHLCETRSILNCEHTSIPPMIVSNTTNNIVNHITMRKRTSHASTSYLLHAVCICACVCVFVMHCLKPEYYIRNPSKYKIHNGKRLHCGVT